MRGNFLYLYFDARGSRAPAVSFGVIWLGSPAPALSISGPHRRARTAQKFTISHFGLTAGGS